MKTKTKQKTLQEMLDATKRTQYTDKDIVASIKGPISDSKVEFFTLGKYVSNDDLIKEYESRGLIPCDPITLCEYDIKNPEGMDKMKYVGIPWKDKDNNWCFATFRQWYDDERYVDVYRNNSDVWNDRWWFAALRKSALDTKSSVPDSFGLRLLELEQKVERLEKFIEKGKKLFNKEK